MKLSSLLSSRRENDASDIGSLHRENCLKENEIAAEEEKGEEERLTKRDSQEKRLKLPKKLSQ